MPDPPRRVNDDAAAAAPESGLGEKRNPRRPPARNGRAGGQGDGHRRAGAVEILRVRSLSFATSTPGGRSCRGDARFAAPSCDDGELIVRMRAGWPTSVALCISDPPAWTWRTTSCGPRRISTAPAWRCPSPWPPARPLRAGDALGFPLLSKPRFGRAAGVVVHRARGIGMPPARGGVWQDSMPGEEYDLNLFVERDGSVLPPRAALDRLKEGLVEMRSAVERVNTRRRRARRGAVRSLGLEGPIGRGHPARHDGSPAVLEVNARWRQRAVGARGAGRPRRRWKDGRCA